MRRSQCAIKETAAMESILQRCRIGRLATSGQDGYPYITPVNFVYFRGAVYFHCAHQGEKIDNLRRDPKVCFAVDIPLAYKESACEPEAPPCSVHQFYHSVIIRGRAEIVSDPDEKVTALNALMGSHEGVAGYALINADMPMVAACTVVAVRIVSMTGKSDLAQKKTPEQRQHIANFFRQRGLPGDSEAAALIGGR